MSDDPVENSLMFYQAAHDIVIGKRERETENKDRERQRRPRDRDRESEKEKHRDRQKQRQRQQYRQTETARETYETESRVTEDIQRQGERTETECALITSSFFVALRTAAV